MWNCVPAGWNHFNNVAFSSSSFVNHLSQKLFQFWKARQFLPFAVVVFDWCGVALSCYRITLELRRPRCSRLIFFFEIFQNFHIFFGIHSGFIPTFLEIGRQYVSTISIQCTEIFFFEWSRQTFFITGSPFLCQTWVSSFCVRVM